MFYFVKTPGWLKKIYGGYEWNGDTKEKQVYLTFDDGPHPEATPFVLDTLRDFNAKGTFFCIGKNVADHPEIFERIRQEGHAVGNHTYNHLNGWKTDSKTYLENIKQAAALIPSNLFRPPYGRITKFQARHLGVAMGVKNPRVIMWDVLSADFDEKISPEQCLQNVILNVKPGSIIIFHDSRKAFSRLEYTLPRTLVYLREQGFKCLSLSGIEEK